MENTSGCPMFDSLCSNIDFFSEGVYFVPPFTNAPLTVAHFPQLQVHCTVSYIFWCKNGDQSFFRLEDMCREIDASNYRYISLNKLFTITSCNNSERCIHHTHLDII